MDISITDIELRGLTVLGHGVEPFSQNIFFCVPCMTYVRLTRNEEAVSAHVSNQAYRPTTVSSLRVSGNYISALISKSPFRHLLDLSHILRPPGL
jgi:hypothetical protein